ncbi:hypothetical protein [Anatilimnocola floriformis]|uniref:hypothetical protein n=1 Tax=Anatilimnocola floriformis TaxID=2948575 RepID=UPI0020C3A61B|nr:hypothetical protein [Anatilimnocola floriformis]
MSKERSRSIQSKRLVVERLEDRSLMAGNVTAAVSGGVLVITGDTADNGITVDYIASNNTYQVTGTTPTGGTATTINSLDTSVPANAQIFSGVTKGVTVNAGAGNDNLVFGAATSTTFKVVGNLEIDMGLGNDTVAIGRNGNAAGGATPVENEMNISKALVVKLGGGGDTLDITNTTVGGNMVIHADPASGPTTTHGADTVRFPTTFTPTGGTLQTFPVTVAGKTTVILGAGADTFNALNLTSRKGMLIQDQAGNLNFDLVNGTVGGEFKMVKNGGTANDIDIRNLNTGTMRMSTGNGVDTIAIRDSIFARMYIETAAGRDQITIGNTRVTKLGLIDGARDKARLTQEAGNVLRGVVKVRTFT